MKWLVAVLMFLVIGCYLETREVFDMNQTELYQEIGSEISLLSFEGRIPKEDRSRVLDLLNEAHVLVYSNKDASESLAELGGWLEKQPHRHSSLEKE